MRPYTIVCKAFCCFRVPVGAKRTEDVYKIVTRKYAYVIYYTIDGDEIVILSVRHFARQRLHEDI